MIRWLLILLFIYLVIRLIQGPKRKKRSSIRFHFGNFQNRKDSGSNTNGKPSLEDIEEAEYEDITEKTKKEDSK